MAHRASPKTGSPTDGTIPRRIVRIIGSGRAGPRTQSKTIQTVTSENRPAMSLNKHHELHWLLLSRGLPPNFQRCQGGQKERETVQADLHPFRKDAQRGMFAHLENRIALSIFLSPFRPSVTVPKSVAPENGQASMLNVVASRSSQASIGGGFLFDRAALFRGVGVVPWSSLFKDYSRAERFLIRRRTARAPAPFARTKPFSRAKRCHTVQNN